MNRNEYKNELNKVYSKYFSQETGHCIYFEKCKKSVCNNPCKFYSDKANLGSEYGMDPNLPKIVMVGLEALGKDDKVEDIEYPSESAYNPHYKGVRYVIAYLLSKIAGEQTPNNSLKKELIEYNETIKKYALLNCYKCAFDKKAQNLSHTDDMKKHCQEILFDEIKVLDPDFLVIQIKGNRPDNFKNNVLNVYGGSHECIIGDESTGAYKIERQSRKPFILIWTYHGSSDPDKKIRAWTNDNSKGCRYIKNLLNPVLDKAIETYNESSS